MNLQEFKQKLRTSIETKKVVFGTEKVEKLLKTGKVDFLVFSNNFHKKGDFKHYSKLSKIEIYNFPGTNMELGEVCGKPFSVSVIGFKK